MKKLVLIAVTFFAATCISAQTKQFVPSTFFKDTLSPFFRLPDSLKNKLWQKNDDFFSPPPGSMPKKFVYLGNNGNGFDVYQTLQDNMPILKPDSTVNTNMPVVDPAFQSNIPVMKPNRPGEILN